GERLGELVFGEEVALEHDFAESLARAASAHGLQKLPLLHHSLLKEQLSEFRVLARLHVFSSPVEPRQCRARGSSFYATRPQVNCFCRPRSCPARRTAASPSQRSFYVGVSAFSTRPAHFASRAMSG